MGNHHQTARELSEMYDHMIRMDSLDMAVWRNSLGVIFPSYSKMFAKTRWVRIAVIADQTIV